MLKNARDPWGKPYLNLLNKLSKKMIVFLIMQENIIIY